MGFIADRMEFDSCLLCIISLFQLHRRSKNNGKKKAVSIYSFFYPFHTAGKFNHFPSLNFTQSINTCNPISNQDHSTDLIHLKIRIKVANLTFECQAPKRGINGVLLLICGFYVSAILLFYWISIILFNFFIASTCNFGLRMIKYDKVMMFMCIKKNNVLDTNYRTNSFLYIPM